jgi:hypothetical protein
MEQDTMESLWTGRKELHLVDAADRLVAVIELVIRIDNVTLWHDDRTLAVMDRDRFRRWAWLTPPLPAFDIDDVVWSVEGATAYLTVDGDATFALDRFAVADLLSVI